MPSNKDNAVSPQAGYCDVILPPKSALQDFSSEPERNLTQIAGPHVYADLHSEHPHFPSLGSITIFGKALLHK